MRQVPLQAVAVGLAAIGVAVASVPAVDAADAAHQGLPAFADCLGSHAMTTRRFPDRLELPARLPAARVIDRAFRACRRYIQWPRGWGNAKIVFGFRDRGRRFRTCMRGRGRDPGPPTVFLSSRAMGATFPRLVEPVPAACNRILFGR